VSFRGEIDIMPEPPVLQPARMALFADLDGTLAPIESSPDGVGPNARRRRLLNSLSSALGGRFAVISGRGLADLDRVLEGRIRPVAAIHGLVRRRADGTLVAPAAPPAMDQAFKTLRAPALEAPCIDLAERLATDLALEVQKGDMVAELRAPGPDKGAAVRAFMKEPPFAGFTPVYLGDDLTDESGFRAVQAMGGFGALVGTRRPTAARFCLRDVETARDWLVRALERPVDSRS
jgi:trehalose 6-phosphate phosphatase